jgi:hypothetical protein
MTVRSPLVRLCLRMLCQLARTAASIHPCTLCAEPKTSAPFTYFQLNPQILHRFSKARIRAAVAR